MMTILTRTTLLLSTCLFIGCASTSRFTPATTSSSWETEHFTVRFFAGPGSLEEQKTASFYEVIPTRLGNSGRSILSSAHSTGGFGSVINPAPAHYIKLLPDSTSEALIIQETIPNDCCPCNNYIWIRPTSATTFTHSYLQLPPRALQEPSGVDFELPEVVSLKNGTLTYQYSTGPSVTVQADSLPASNEPSPPG